MLENEEKPDLARYVGEEAEPARVARYPVNEAMIRNWVEALGDDNPVYTSRDAARSTGRSDLICPPAMISTWVMSGYRRYREVQELRASGAAESTAYSELMQELDGRGFTSVVATDVEQDYHAEASPGAIVTCRYRIAQVSPLKRTALGEGHFVTLEKQYGDQDGRALAAERFRLLRFAPKNPSPAKRRSAVPPIVRTQDTAFWFDAAAEGRLVIQRCTDCGALRHPPGPACPHCRSFSWNAVEASRQGTLHSWTVVHHPQDAAFGYPLAVALVDLEEGTRLVADIGAVPESGLSVGAPVHIVFEEHAHGEILPRVRLGVLPEEGLDEQRSDRPEPAAGVALPALSLPLDRTAVAAGAIASQDFEDVHHDPGRASERGMRDIFLSINTTNGLVDRFLTDWGGPGLRIHSVRLRLGVPHFAGETLELSGTARPDGTRTRVEVIGRNSDGVHVTATAEVSGSTEGGSR